MPRARSGGIDNTLRENEQRFRDLLDNGHELMCTHALDGAIRWANKSALRLLGLSPEKIVRMRIQDILTPQALAAYPLYVDTLRRNGTANGIMAVVGRDQEVRLWEYSNTLHIEGEREPIVRGVARDVTEREDALRALRASEKLFRSIIEIAHDKFFEQERFVRFVRKDVRKPK